MAGYVMTLSKDNLNEILRECITNGRYSTNFNEPTSNQTLRIIEATFADYFTMKPNDNIYFFCERQIYGIGKIIEINNECKFLNYIGADTVQGLTQEEFERTEHLLPNSNATNRCFCVFEGDPHFFIQGIDMDEALVSNPPAFRMLRAMQQVSFIKLDDIENQALNDIIIKKNENYLTQDDSSNDDNNDNRNNGRYNISDSFLESLRQTYLDDYVLRYNDLVNDLIESNGSLRHEMALEATLCDVLTRRDDTIFGHWDYISRQVVASPFKPVNYMDRIDIFGYRYIPDYNVKSKYLIIELKKGVAKPDVIGQVMKYVDWVKEEYAHGDYSMIEAYVVAHGFRPEVFNAKNEYAVRNYIQGYRPISSCVWDNLRLIKYNFVDGQLTLEEAEANE